MALIVDLINDFHEVMNKNGDPRTNNWFLMSSPFPTLLICLSYVYLVKYLGPRLMENRKPIECRDILIVYNFLQVVFSLWLFYEIGMSGWLTGRYNFRCQPVDYSYHPQTLRMANVCWWYYFSKFTEFFDTIFFVLRKKNQQVSSLHVIHHGCMPMSVWFGVKFTPGGHSTFFGLVNTFVHIVMYTYYMLAAMGPRYQKYLWWKKYVTTLQMVQFVAIMAHAFQLLFVDCDYPKEFVWWIGMHAVMFYFLFSDFYKQAYKRRDAEKLKATKKYDEIGHSFSNGSAKTNGATSNELPLNGHATSSGYCNGGAAHYYIKAVSDIHLRTIASLDAKID